MGHGQLFSLIHGAMSPRNASVLAAGSGSPRNRARREISHRFPAIRSGRAGPCVSGMGRRGRHKLVQARSQTEIIPGLFLAVAEFDVVRSRVR